MAAAILKVGVTRVRIDPEGTEKVQDAITRESIRALVSDGVIYAVPKKGVSRGRHRRKAGTQHRGSRKGAAGARMPRKRLWINHVRAMRRHLRILRGRGDITPETFRSLYMRVKGGQIRTLRALRDIVKQVGRR